MTEYRVAKWLWMFFLLFAPIFGVAQTMTPHTSNSNDIQVQAHAAGNCTLPNGHNCFSTSSGGTLVQMIISQGKSLGADSSGYAYIYSDPIFGGNNTWAKQNQWGSGLSYVQYGSDGNLYSLRDTCLSTGHNIEKLVGSTWQTVAGCFKSFSMDQTGTGLLEGIDINGALWESTNYGVSFTKTSVCTANSNMLSVGVLNSSMIGVICGDHSVWYGASSSLTRMSGSATQITGRGATIYVTGTDDSIYHWVLGTNTAWDHLVSPSGITFLNFGDESNLWAVGSGGTPNRYVEWALRYTRTYNATTTCNGNCPSVTHNAQTQAQWIINGSVVSNGTFASSGPVSPTTQVNLSSVADLDTPSDCLVYAADCFVGVGTEQYVCSQAGKLASDSGSSSGSGPILKVAHTHSQWLTPVPPTEIDKGLWDYQVAAECSNTSSPLFNPNFVYADHDLYHAFDSHAPCISFFGGPYHCFSPYLGNGVLADHPYYEDPGPQYCDQ